MPVVGLMSVIFCALETLFVVFDVDFLFLRVIYWALSQRFFVEGLILAQDERWRRA